MSPPLDYVISAAQLPQVSLVGLADADFWRERLGKEGLFPYPGGGQVEITLGVVEVRWKGIDSLELSLKLSVARREAGGEKEFFLLQAFHSSALFAWVERNIFLTPYSRGKILLVERVPVRIGLYGGKEWYFSAQMSAQGRQPRAIDDTWEGVVHLPGDRIRHIRRHFYARLGGRAQAYPFLPGVDSLWINAATERKVFNWLLDSHFAPLEWRVCAAATHARSLTVQSR